MASAPDKFQAAVPFHARVANRSPAPVFRLSAWLVPVKGSFKLATTLIPLVTLLLMAAVFLVSTLLVMGSAGTAMRLMNTVPQPNQHQ